ncbi:MAG: MutS-related protein, family 1 [uncultured Aureispira sp.]|uniref:MutS-related protein, family 1 n=1 Tax=uncultured Aureispira sp. TaxID=1331704 RepID=A0A6S6S1I0_9BACT|nr:MAG: MutS-related protein, family 1 [uncultured Aureispira sp.]
MNLEKIYQERLDAFLKQQKEKTSKMFQIGNVRVILFVLMIYFLFQFFSTEFEVMFWWWCFLAVIPVFVVFLRLYQGFFDEKQRIDELIVINEKELKILKSNQPAFDGGQEFDDPNHDYCSDLDLFGSAGIFAFVNRTSTAKGKERLANLFKAPLDDVAAIYTQQEAVKVLNPKIDFRQAFMANGRITEDTLEDIAYLQAWTAAPAAFLDSTPWKITRVVLPLLSILALVYFIITFNHLPLMLMGMLNFALLGIKSKYVGKEHTEIGKRQGILKMYVSLLNLANQEDFGDSSILNEIKKTAKEAQSGFGRLSKIVDYFDQRLNIFVGLGLNLLILYDVQCLFALEAWKKKHKQFLTNWLDTVAELDGLISLATFSYNNAELNFPQLEKSDELFIHAEALGHPLIPVSERVCNDTKLGSQHKIFVVTGSNMAGKSTFLRCVALNLLLAKCGAPVCATSFKSSLMDIMTSMRVQDSISQQTSYFQAELLRLQYIIRTLKENKPTFIILDEILKGTNSEDKLLGSELLVRHFLDFNCLAMVATHDLELGNMQDELPGKVENLCFESIIEKDELSFDYKLNRGIAKNKNATFLMRKMEIVPKELFR